jgi:hypothetical protein
MVVYAYNTSYEGHENGRICLRSERAKMLARPCLKKKQDMVVHVYNPSYTGNTNRKIAV